MTQVGLAFLGILLIAQNGGADHTMGRAGYPACVAWYARPSDTGRYVGYYVGGGNPLRVTEPDRHSWEGTWGWDYRGFCWPSRIMLDWYHGRRYQGGQGAYRTDGPNLLRQLKEKQ